MYIDELDVDAEFRFMGIALSFGFWVALGAGRFLGVLTKV